MIGSQVGHSINLLKGAIYKRFPPLWRRSITFESWYFEQQSSKCEYYGGESKAS
jgi:hypothetical protein